MIRNVLEHIGGIERYGIISILLFFACFVGTLVWAFRLKKPFLNRMAAKPLEPDSPDLQPDASRHE
jgi:cbb3-type cytochrome oxidase subunit 3